MALPGAARPAALLLAVVLGLAACADDAADDPTDATGATAVATTTSAPAAGRVVNVAFRGGVVTGDTRHQVRRGEVVRLVVASDVADEVHVHGYDDKAEVPAGGTVELSFTADIPGVFEVELERQGRRLLTLEVQG